MDDATARWYESYFGEDYLRVYRFADTADQLSLLRRLLADHLAGDRVLDLPCGQGRHAVALAGWGAQVWGLDLNRALLTVAQRRARERAVPLRLTRGDMRRLPYADGWFDAAICMFTSLGYFDTDAEHQAVLDGFARVVRGGGRFVLDVASVDHVRHQPDASAWERDGLRVESRYRWHEATHRAVTERQVIFPDGRRQHMASSVRLYEPDELHAMLERAGWQPEQVFGSYAGEPPSRDRPRHIVVSRRRAD